MRIDELRSALHDHADTVRDSGSVARLDAVHGRVRVVRRRRAAGVAAAAVAVIATVSLSVLPGMRDDTPPPANAPRSLAGHEVPAFQVATGYTYDYVEGIEGKPGENPLEATVGDDDHPVLVAFASSESGSQLDLEVADGDGWSAPSGAFSTYALVPPGSHDLTLTQREGLGDGTLALAVYELSDERPDGVTNGATTFRSTTANQTLVDAVIGKPGETELTTSVVLPQGRLVWSDLCYGSQGGPDTMVRISVDGAGSIGSGCQKSEPGLDQGEGGLSFVGPDPAPRGRPVTVRVWLSSTSEDSQRVLEDPDAVIGFAVSVETSEPTPVLGADVAPRQESFGHTWDLSTVETLTRRGDTFVLTGVGGALPRLITVVTRGTADGPKAFRVDVGGEVDEVQMSVDTGPTVVVGTYLALPGPGDTLRVGIPEGLTNETEVAVATYTLAD